MVLLASMEMKKSHAITVTYHGYYVGTFPTNLSKDGGKKCSAQSLYEKIFVVDSVDESTRLMNQKKQALFLLKGLCNRALLLTQPY